MNNSDMPAMPSDHTYIDGDINCREMHTGLTKREHFAGLAMQGIMASIKDDQVWSMTDVARTAIQMSSVLLEELDA